MLRSWKDIIMLTNLSLVYENFKIVINHCNFLTITYTRLNLTATTAQLTKNFVERMVKYYYSWFFIMFMLGCYFCPLKYLNKSLNWLRWYGLIWLNVWPLIVLVTNSTTVTKAEVMYHIITSRLISKSIKIIIFIHSCRFFFRWTPSYKQWI